MRAQIATSSVQTGMVAIGILKISKIERKIRGKVFHESY
jgi:hypothetical protein